MVSVCRGIQTGDTIEAVFSMEFEKSHWFHNSVAVERGTLVYALDMKERWETAKVVAGVRDYEIYPESAWNYALEENMSFEIQEGHVGAVPFSKEYPPIRLRTRGRRLDSWEIVGCGQQRRASSRQPNLYGRERGGDQSYPLWLYQAEDHSISMVSE